MSKLEILQANRKDILYNLIRGGLAAIPLAGGLAVETYGWILNAPITKRREKWMTIVIEKLLELETQNDGFIESLQVNEEFISFLIESSQIAFKNHQEKKIEALKNTVINFFKREDLEYDKKFSFLKIVDEISPIHIQILLYIFHNEEDIIENILGYPQFHEKYISGQEIEKFYFRKCVIDLEKQGLIRISKDFTDFFSGGGYSSDEGAPSIKLLDFGKEFIEFISE